LVCNLKRSLKADRIQGSEALEALVYDVTKRTCKEGYSPRGTSGSAARGREKVDAESSNPRRGVDENGCSVVVNASLPDPIPAALSEATQKILRESIAIPAKKVARKRNPWEATRPWNGLFPDQIQLITLDNPPQTEAPTTKKADEGKTSEG
jgi:hypothetical protein